MTKIGFSNEMNGVFSHDLYGFEQKNSENHFGFSSLRVCVSAGDNKLISTVTKRFFVWLRERLKNLIFFVCVVAIAGDGSLVLFIHIDNHSSVQYANLQFCEDEWH